jgi:hypothetical protein
VRSLLTIIVALSTLPLVVVAYKDGPVPGRTGGFGGPTCQACHQDNPINTPGGELSLTGIPERYTPGETYPITVRLKKPELARGGFSMAARFVSGESARRQAGEWQADERVTFNTDAQTNVRYAQHSSVGSRPAAPGSIEWELHWKAPIDAGPIQFNVAANAANDDASPLGDFIYVKEFTVSSQSAGR